MNHILSKKSQGGVTLVEIVVAIAALGIIFATLGSTIIFGIRNSKFSGERDRATFIANEGIEAVRNIRDNDFSNLIDGTYGLSIVGNEWVLTGSQDVVDEFTRTVDISSIDASTKEVVTTVSWDQVSARPGSVSATTHLSYWQEEIQNVQTAELSPSDDNLLYLFGPTRNYGGFFVIGASSYINSILRFDLSSLPSNINIVSAQLNLTAYSNNFDTSAVSVHEILPGNIGWLEGNKSGQVGGVNESSWNFKDTGNAIPWTGSAGLSNSGIDYLATAEDSLSGPWVSNNTYHWSLSPGLVQKWADNLTDNHGVVLRNNISNFKFFYSKEYSGNPAHHPKLVVGYEEEVVGDWSNPAEESFLDISGNQNGMKIQTQGNYVYLVRSGGNPDFIIIDISNPAIPTVSGSLSLPGGPRNITVNGNYAYIASNRNNQELQIIDISVPSSPSVAGTLNLPGNSNANGIIYDNSKVYVVRSSGGSDELSIIDVNNPALPSEIGSVNLNSTAYEVYVSGNYAYVASAHNSQELQVVDITSPASPGVIATYGLSGNYNALSITGFDDTVLLGRVNGDVAVLDISSPSSPTLLGTYNDHNDDIRDISLGNSNNYAFLASDANSAEFQVIDISTLASPVLVGSYNISGDLNGITYHQGLDRVFAAGENNSKELEVLAPQ